MLLDESRICRGLEAIALLEAAFPEKFESRAKNSVINLLAEECPIEFTIQQINGYQVINGYSAERQKRVMCQLGDLQAIKLPGNSWKVYVCFLEERDIAALKTACKRRIQILSTTLSRSR